MKKSSLLLAFAAGIVYGECHAQPFSGTLDRTQFVTVFKKDLLGFNAGTGTLEKPFNVCDNCSGGVNALYQQQVEANIGSRVMYRCPAGEAGMYYNFWYSGWGNYNNVKGHSESYNLNASQRNAIYGNYANYNDLTVTTAYQTKTPAINNLFGVINPPNHKNNILFPYINIITNNRTETGNGNFVINMVEHYRDFRSSIGGQLSVNNLATANGVINAGNYFPRNDIFQNTNIIAGITTMAQLTASSLSANTKDIVKQNVDAFTTLIKNRVRVVHVELGNELTNPGRFIDNISCNPTTPTYANFTSQEIPNLLSTDHVIWYRMYNGACGNDNTFSNNSERAYGNLCKMYIALIKEVVNTLYTQTNDPFYLDIKNNLKFGVPYRSLGSGYQKWGDYLEAKKDSIGFHAFVMHPYSGSTVALSGTLDAKFDDLKGRYVTRFNTFYKTDIPNFLAPKTNVTELWLTEWEIEGGTVEKYMYNSLLHGMVYMDEMMSFIDLNGNMNLNVPGYTRKDVIKLANHQWLWGGSGDFAGNLITMDYNTTAQTIKYRTNYFMNKLMLPIFSDNVKVLNQPNGGINESVSDLYFRTFTEHVALNGNCPPYSDITYVYFNNKANSDYTIDLQDWFEVCSHCALTIERSQIYANKLSASRGKTNYRPSENLYIGGAGNQPVNLDSSVQVIENEPVDVSLLGQLPIRHYSAGYYKITLSDGGLVSPPPPCGGGSSQVQAVSPELQAQATRDRLNLYPNPVTEGQFVLEYLSDLEGSGTIEITDISGQKLSAKNVRIGLGANRYAVEVPNAAPGTYIVKLHTAKTTEVRKVIIQ